MRFICVAYIALLAIPSVCGDSVGFCKIHVPCLVDCEVAPSVWNCVEFKQDLAGVTRMTEVKEVKGEAQEPTLVPLSLSQLRRVWSGKSKKVSCQSPCASQSDDFVLRLAEV